MTRGRVALALVALWVVLASPATSAAKAPPSPTYSCTDVYAPVCGVNGVTYSNACQAGLAGVTVASQGECGTNGGAMRKLQQKPRPGDCICLDVYAPVCGVDGNTYSNACQAGCAGVAVARTGSCDGSGGLASARKLLQIRPGKCVCLAIYKPVCGVDGVTYGNDCLAGCAGVTVASQGECGTNGGTMRKLQQKRRPGDCICLDVYAPVCGVDGNTYSNDCQAGCAGVAVARTGSCDGSGGLASARKLLQTATTAVIHPNPACICPAIYAPVCGADGITYSSACQAGCSQVEVVSQGECPVCGCSKEYNPQCGSNGQTYGNPCLAECAKVTYTPGECPVSCICTKEYNPQCGSDGQTYGNPCMADCAKVTYTPGECPPPTPPTGCVCPLNYDPVCGVDGVTYGNACAASCAKVAVLQKGECAPPIQCQSGTDPVAKCLVDPCSNPHPCKGRPGLTCQASYCVLPFTYLGQTLQGTCQAFYVDIATQTIAKCDAPATPPAITCDPTDPGVRCLRDPCTDPSPCQGKPGLVCVPNYCGKPVTYLGTPLSGACQPVYVDTATNTVAQCSAPAPPPTDPCASITKTYSPVCGADGKTYHNKASATCRKVAVAHSGACALCPATTSACSYASRAPVCCSDGNSYCNPCTAKALRKTVVHRGTCSAPKCLSGGSVCLLANPKCCSGMSCSGGPVLRDGQVFGTCVQGQGPKG